MPATVHLWEPEAQFLTLPTENRKTFEPFLLCTEAQKGTQPSSFSSFPCRMPALLGPGLSEAECLCSRSPPLVLGQGGEEESAQNYVFSRVSVVWACSTWRAEQVVNSVWAGQEDLLEEVVCNKALRSRAAEGRSPRWTELSRVEMCWESCGQRQAQGTRRPPSVTAEVCFRERLEGNGAPDATWNLMFNPLSVYLLSCRGCP